MFFDEHMFWKTYSLCIQKEINSEIILPILVK